MIRTAQTLFLPYKTGSYYWVTEHVLVYEFFPDSVVATRFTLSGKERRITNIYTYPCTPETPHDCQQAIADIARKAGSYTKVACILPTTKTVSKHTTLPLTERSHIAMALPSALEASFPFEVSNAALDFIFYPHNDGSQSDIVAFATPEETIAEYTKIFEQAGVPLDSVHVRGLELFSWYHYAHDNSQDMYVYIDCIENDSCIILAHRSYISALRTLPGARLPESDDDETRIDDYVDTLTFTINAMCEENDVLEVDHIALHAPEHITTHIQERLADRLRTDTRTAWRDKLPTKLSETTLANETGQIPKEAHAGIAAGVATPLTESFSLYKERQERAQERTIAYQLITATILLITLCTGLFVYSLVSVRALHKEAQKSEEEVRNSLQKRFNIRQRKKAPLKTLMAAAEQQVTTEESIWAALSSNRFAFLHYLEHISKHIDRTELGLQLKRLSMQNDEKTNNTKVALEGTVQTYDALRSLEGSLEETRLFESVPELQERKFDIALTVAPQEGE